MNSLIFLNLWCLRTSLLEELLALILRQKYYQIRFNFCSLTSIIVKVICLLYAITLLVLAAFNASGSDVIGTTELSLFLSLTGCAVVANIGKLSMACEYDQPLLQVRINYQASKISINLCLKNLFLVSVPVCTDLLTPICQISILSTLGTMSSNPLFGILIKHLGSTLPLNNTFSLGKLIPFRHRFSRRDGLLSRNLRGWLRESHNSTDIGNTSNRELEECIHKTLCYITAIL